MDLWIPVIVLSFLAATVVTAIMGEWLILYLLGVLAMALFMRWDYVYRPFLPREELQRRALHACTFAVFWWVALLATIGWLVLNKIDAKRRHRESSMT